MLSFKTMIVSKPKVQTLISISLFIGIALSSSIVMYWYYGQQEGGGAWWLPMLAALVGSLGLAVAVRYFSAYKVLRIAKEKIDVHFPFLFSRKRYAIKDIKAWREENIKTKNGNYRELQLYIEGRKRYIRVSLQENTEYKKLVSYLQKKAGRKMLKSE